MGSASEVDDDYGPFSTKAKMQIHQHAGVRQCWERLPFSYTDYIVTRSVQCKMIVKQVVTEISQEAGVSSFNTFSLPVSFRDN